MQGRKNDERERVNMDSYGPGDGLLGGIVLIIVIIFGIYNNLKGNRK